MITSDSQAKKRLEKNVNRLNKSINDTLKERKKMEQDNQSIVNTIKQLETQKFGLNKDLLEKEAEKKMLEEKA